MLEVVVARLLRGMLFRILVSGGILNFVTQNFTWCWDVQAGIYFTSMQQMAMPSFAITSPPSHGTTLWAPHARRPQRLHRRHVRSQVRAVAQAQLQYQKLGDSDLLISEVTLGTVCMILELQSSNPLAASNVFSVSRWILFFPDDFWRAKHGEGSTWHYRLFFRSRCQYPRHSGNCQYKIPSLLLLTIPLSVFSSDRIYFSIFPFGL